MREITFTCDEWMGSFLDNQALRSGSTRSEAIRTIISQHMMAQALVDVANRAAQRVMEEEQ